MIYNDDLEGVYFLDHSVFVSGFQMRQMANQWSEFWSGVTSPLTLTSVTRTSMMLPTTVMKSNTFHESLK